MSEPSEPVFKRVDEDWKERVDRERVVAEGASKPDAPASGKRSAPKGSTTESTVNARRRGSGGASVGGSSSDFSVFLSSLSMQVMMAMGELPHPVTGEPVPQDLEQARYLIDILGMLREKTSGNLTPEEENLFEGTLYELRMKYVSKTPEAPAP